MNILVINCGSSSIKYQIFDISTHESRVSGTLERIGESRSRLSHLTRDGANTPREAQYSETVPDHRVGFDLIKRALEESGPALDTVDAVGHRIVHGGESFHTPALLSPDVIKEITRLSSLAPLHNPPNLIGVEIAMKLLPKVPHVAVFDTAFHQTMPEYAFRYALPEAFYREHDVRRYGFHGTSHAYVARQAAAFLQRPLNELNLITLHLGNGASAAAIEAGQCVDTSMGLTPLEGLVMGSRSGDIDPAIPAYLARRTGQDLGAIDEILNKQSGLKGLCGANDMREIKQRADAGEHAAKLAIDVYCYRIKKYIGAYSAILGRIDALVFTAGIGENAAFIREQVCAGLENLGLAIDTDHNSAKTGEARSIHSQQSTVVVLVIPTNEELEIARQTATALGADNP